MKDFKTFVEDAMAGVTTAADAGIPHDTKDMGPRKKKKHKVLTRSYIEIAGKRKRVMR